MEIFVCSCRNQTGLEHWFESIMNTELSEKQLWMLIMSCMRKAKRYWAG